MTTIKTNKTPLLQEMDLSKELSLLGINWLMQK